MYIQFAVHITKAQRRKGPEREGAHTERVHLDRALVVIAFQRNKIRMSSALSKGLGLY